MNTYRKMGWLKDVYNGKDHSFRATFRLPVALKADVDLLAGFSPVEDQGSMGDCTMEALVGLMEFLEIKAGTKFSDLSRRFGYYNELEKEGSLPNDAGAMIRTGIKTLASLGICREDQWPYDAERFADRPDQSCYDAALGHKITAYQRLQSLYEMKACLAMGLPFAFGFRVYPSAMTDAVAKTGDIPMPEAGEESIGGHAMVCSGYTDAINKKRVRNSWGKNWGNGGYGTLPYDYPVEDCWCIQRTLNDLYAFLKINTEEMTA